jgi:acyl-homoserine lactone acylase PvdQ
VGFEMGGGVLCTSRDVEIVQDAAGVFNIGGKDNGGVGGKKGYIYSSSCDLIHILRFVG